MKGYKAILWLWWVALAIGGCATAPTQQAFSLNEYVTFIIPKDPNLYEVTSGTLKGLLWPGFRRRVSYQTKQVEVLRNVSIPGGDFLVERYTANETALGDAGKAGIQYTVKQEVSETTDAYHVTLRPLEVRTYQGGLILPYPIPRFTERDLIDYLMSAQFHFKMEIDSPYNSESTHANFVRLMESKTSDKGERDPVTGKIFKSRFFLQYRGKKLSFALETYPYRNGSKAVFYLTIYGIMTTQNTVDLKKIIEDVGVELGKIVNA